MIPSSCSSRERMSLPAWPEIPGNRRADPGLAALGQFRQRVPADADDRGLRDHRLLPAHVSHRVHPAAVGERLSLRHQLFEVSRAIPCGVDDFLAQLQHLVRRI